MYSTTPDAVSMAATSTEAHPRSITKVTKDPVVPLEVDNPCWGSPTNCSLADLLRWTSKNEHGIIPYDSQHYLVLNKPPDLRMDGLYPATVHKLLTYLYPPPSLMEKCSDNKNNNKNHNCNSNTVIDDDVTKDHDNEFQARLLEEVSQLHQYNDVHDNFLRHCHQLDYATSGILLVAKTKAAAFHVARLLEDRKVVKTYVAIVVGHIMRNMKEKKTTTMTDGDITATDVNVNVIVPSDKFPSWTGEKMTTIQKGKISATIDLTNDETMVRQHLQQLEKRYRKLRSQVNKQHNNKKMTATSTHQEKYQATFPGYQPAHTIFQKWKARMAKKDEDDENEANGPAKKKHRKLKTTLLSECDWERIWEPVDTYLAQTREGNIEESSWYQDLEWKKLGTQDYEFKQAMIKATDLHNDILRNVRRESEQVKESQSLEVDDLPTLFCLPNNKDTASDKQLDTFFVFCPLADDPDSFSMVVPSHIVEDFPHLPAQTRPQMDKEESAYDFKPSLTKCTVLEQGHWTLSDGTNIPITKVKLFPITGRRHQLRVHMALAGHPILGDLTYCPTSSFKGGELSTFRVTSPQNKNRRSNSGLCSRMCLHAHSLTLPSLLGHMEGEWKVDAPDPFQIINGNLTLVTNHGINF
jgi:23S rRNA-/tRNA-specific pseudouridylate synthase